MKSKQKPKPFFSASPAVDGKTLKSKKKSRSEKNPPSKKTSLDPLYETTDQYRQVIKPLKVEDFLSS
jgi:hypothetical protein